MQPRFAISIITFLLLVLSATSQGTWEKLEVPATEHLRSVFFTDSLYGWAVGDTGTIIHTMDGGDSWMVQDPQTDNSIRSVFFLNRDTGWAVSWNFEGFFGTLLLKTNDGGVTWVQQQYQEDNIFMNCILFLDPLTGWMGGSPHAIVKTTDGGLSWSQAAVDTTPLAFFPVLEIKFYDENYGYASGGIFDIAGVTWSTSDGGETWQPIDNLDAPADEVHGLHIYDSITVIGAGGDPDFGYGVGMLRTDDGGTNWDYEELTMQGNAYDIDFRTKSEAWAPLGPREKLIYSLDAGMTWVEMPSPDSTAIFDMIFPDTLHGFAVGYDAAVLKYDPNPVGLWEPQQHEIGFSIYPNPCKGWFRVKMQDARRKTQDARPKTQDARGQKQVLRIYNIAGRKVKEINFEDNTVDVSWLPGGVYFIQLQTRDWQGTRKLIVK